MSSISVALVGCGFMGRMHAQVYHQLPGVQVKACLSLHGESSAALAADLGAVKVTDFSQILEDPSIEVVDICLPTDLHAEFAIRALEAGKHVLCEKPMALDLASADRMLAAAESSGKTLMIAQCIRFWPEYQRLKQIHDDGSMGDLRSLQLTRFSAFPAWSADGWIAKPERSGGAAMDLHIHDTDFVYHLLGEPDETISRGSVDHRGMSRIFSLLTYGSTTVQTEGGWDLPGNAPFRMAFRAVFDQGLVMWDGGPMTIYREGEDPQVIDDLPKMSAGSLGGNISDLGGYFFEMDYFYSCLKSGEPVTQSSPESSRAALALALTELDIATVAAKRGARCC